MKENKQNESTLIIGLGADDQDKMVNTMERELLKTHEDLQSANEELETSTEELRSLNEELSTVNSQLKDKIDQLQRAHDDLSNFFASTNLATVFLSNELKIMRYTPSAERLLRIGPQDLEHPINEISRTLIDDNTLSDAKNVLDRLESNEKKMQNDDGRWFVRKILPYRTEDKRIAGVVLTFSDVTELEKATRNVENRERQHAVVAKLGLKALSGENIQELMDHAVREIAHTLDAHYCKVLEYHPDRSELFLKSGIGWKKGLVGKACVSSDKGSQAGYTLMEHGPVIVEDLRDEKRFSGPALLTDHKVISGISCIVENGDYPYGVLGVHSRDKKIYTIDDANFLMSVANLLSIAIHRKNSQLKLRESEERLRMAKDSNNFGTFEHNIVTGKLEWDDILKDIWGVSHDVKPTMDLFYECLHSEDIEKTKVAIGKSIDPENDGHYHTVYRVKNKITDKQSWIEASGQVIFENKQPIKMIGMIIDITAQKLLESSLNNAVIKLESANTKKNEFLATLGHELRNPLAAINSAAQIMQLDIKESEWALDMMANNVKLISSLLDDLLDLTRIERGKIKLNKEIILLNEILTDALESFKPKTLDKKQKLSFDIPEENIYVNGDRTRLEQILNNLLINAHKFTPEKGRIKAVLEKNGDFAVIKIQDNGIGLEKDKFEKIFDPFEQVTTSKMNETGLGIGLSLVHKFVKLHDGEIKVDSNGTNKGTTFTLMLPLSENDARPKIIKKQAQKPLKNRLRVMIIDDNEDAVRGLKSILEKENCHVNVAYKGATALKKIDKFKPEALIIDIGLPEISGYDLVKKIKNRYQNNVLYIAVTGYGHEDAQKKSKKAGFDYHLNKPVKIDTLFEILNTIS